MGNEDLTLFKKRKKTLIFTLIVFVFLIGFYLGGLNAETRISDLRLELDTLNLDLRSMEQRTAFSDLFEDECSTESINYISRKISETARELDSLEERGLEETNDYQLLKERHNINQVSFYIDLKQFVERCSYERDIILFFFNSSKPELAEQQGKEIDELSQERDIVVLPMDYGYTEKLDFFYNHYDIQTLPAVVVNFDTVFEGITTDEELNETIR